MSYSWILPDRLAQGSRPTYEDASRFDVVVLCAVEHQPSRTLFPSGVEVVHAGFDDARDPTREDLARAARAARIVARRVHEGKRVLVTCRQGRNRSGLVVATALHLLTGAPGALAADHVKARRDRALTNDAFVDALRELGT